ncbi:YbjN domain-containing protein [Intrasporangium oryzae]|uniref:YbjN domain-containing protein n=1 Tax=Intrasporangium oryzae TaxID=412687 RepID=UPI000A029672|nr:YbjN domain-containing protein [Intrasporangium oryzae]
MTEPDTHPDTQPDTRPRAVEPDTPPERDRVDAATARLTAYLSSVGLEWELGSRPGEYLVTLPGEQKLKTVVSLLVRPRTTSVSAFVIRNPDENHEAFYRTLLRKNLRLTGIAYAIDTDGDVYVRGEVPTEALDADHLDQLFGVVLAASDHAFNELLALGFLGSMKKEWAWRVSRGESTRNLEAFRHLLED